MNPDEPDLPGDSSLWFFGACVFEGGLVAVAWLLSALADVPLFSDFHWNAMDLIKGGAAAVPPGCLFVWSLSSDWAPLTRIRGALDSHARPIFSGWSAAQLLLLSIVAGVSEEVLFRSVIQGALSGYAGPVGALLIASVIFGLAHMITPAYAILAGLMSVYIGWLWMQGGNLLIPIVTHAVYDFIALMYFMRTTKPTGGRRAGD
mgnify:CR=1 FL=1